MIFVDTGAWIALSDWKDQHHGDAVDEALWDGQFAANDDDKMTALVAAVESEINEGKTLPMFDEHGKFIEHR